MLGPGSRPIQGALSPPYNNSVGVFDINQRATEDVQSKSPALHETHLSGFILGVGRGRAEFLPPDFTGAFQFAVATLAKHRFDEGVAHAALTQVVGELDAAGARTVVGYVAFGEAAVREPVFFLECVEQRGDVASGEAGLPQLAGEFKAAVLAPRQQAQRAFS